MKNTIVIILVTLATAFCACSRQQKSASLNEQPLATLLDTLDAAIAHYSDYTDAKERHIKDLRRQLEQKHQPAARYAVQSLLYDAYHVYDADSAMAICNRQIDIAQSLGNADWEAEWAIKRSFILAATGLLEDAERALEDVEARSASLPQTLRTELYRQKIYIYSHMRQFVGNAGEDNPSLLAKNEAADVMQQNYNDSILMTVEKTDPLYLWQMAWGPDGQKVKPQLERALGEAKLDSRYDAMSAYSLAHICDLEGNDEERLRALVMSAIADVRCCNHDIASLEELALLLFERGDIERPYVYVNYCLSRDLAFHNRVRIISTGSIFGDIHKANVEQQHKQRRWIMVGFGLLVALSVVLVLVVIQLIVRVRRSRKGERALALANHQHEQTNQQLQSVNQQLQEMVEKFDKANVDLQGLNAQLSDANEELRVTNYLKEETVGMTFTLCSNYISKIEEQRMILGRLLKTNQHELLRKHLETPQSNAMLKDFFQHFDALFLGIYPTFVDDFNALLRPEERIQPRDPKGLNTELRIYALVRLGINDSVKIADFLHCSPQTVYNHRLRVRNKSDIPNNEFAAAVQRLGKASR